MTDPINLQPASGTNTNLKTDPIKEQADVAKVTQSGYSQLDSSSELKAETEQKLSLNLEDIRQANNQTANSYINSALIERLNAFNSSLLNSNFNTIDKYQTNILDVVQDSGLLIMTLKNFLHGFKMLGAMNNVISDNNSKATIASSRDKISQVNKTILDTENQITELQQQNQLNKQQFSALNSEINTELDNFNNYATILNQSNNNQDVSNANQNDNSATISQKDLLAIKDKIDQLTEKANDFKNLITNKEQEITQAITNKEQQILLSDKFTKFIDYAEKSMINIPELVKKVIINSGYSYHNVMKLIISISEKSKENIESEKKLAEQDIINKNIATEKEKQESYQEDLLQTQFLSRVLAAFSANIVPSIAGSENNMPFAVNLQAPVALVLTANINDKKFPDLAHKQPYLGDNLSLDGADNPLAYGMILLNYQMQQLKTNMAISNNIITQGQQESSLMQELFDLQDEVDELVFNSLNQAELSQVAQRQSV